MVNKQKIQCPTKFKVRITMKFRGGGVSEKGSLFRNGSSSGNNNSMLL